MSITLRKFPATAAALVEFDAGAAERKAAWESAETELAIDKAHEADTAALDLVQRAYHQDTADINSLANCLRVDLAFMRRMAQKG